MVYIRVAATIANRIRSLFQQRQLNAGVPPLEVKPLYVAEEGDTVSLSTEETATPLLREVVASVAGPELVESETPFVASEKKEGRRPFSRWANR